MDDQFDYENEEQENYQEEEEQEKKSILTPILIGAIVLLTGTAGFFAYKYFSASLKVEIITTEKEAVIKEKDGFKAEADRLKIGYDSLIVIAGENEGIKQQLESERQQVMSLQSQLASAQSRGLSDNSPEIRSLRSQLGAMQNNYNQSIKQIEKLKTENEALTAKVGDQNLRIDNQSRKIDSVNTEKNLLIKDKEDLQATTKQLATTVDYAKKLTAHSIYAEAVNTNGGLFGNKEKATTSAKKADKVRIGFVVSENRISDKGDKDFYILVKDPTGKLLADGGQTFQTADGASMPYSAKQTVYYENKEKSMMMYVNANKFDKGNYTVEVYGDGLQIGKSTITMQ